ncbi:MAG: ABC transporter ATP-binding protein [Candidatus Bathyarchaeia archaeon]
MLKIDKIKVSYGELQALWDVSFHVNDGEITTIIGSNGAGKTTILRTISGLLHPTSGHIEFMGERIDGMPPHQIVERGITHTPAERELFPYMTVLENLELGAYPKEARRKLGETIRWVYELFPILEKRSNQLAGTLSGGEQQMLAIGRSLMSKPRLLMLDEPSLGLAPKLVAMIFDVVRELNRQGVTILLVEQNVRRALRLGHKAYVLETGRIVMQGAGKDMLDDERVKRAYLGI